jgi:hypothetical protein
MLQRRHRLALGWLVCAALLAAPAAAAGGSAAIRLLSPADGAVLVAGETSELRWEPLPAFAGIDEVAEWEAFLSLDGGATYPLRLTPHLDQDVRRIAWRVPPVASDDVRLLFRFGDERRETPVPLPHRLAIRPAAVPLPLGDEGFALARRSAAAAGEAAHAGRPGVVGGVEGSRRGTALRQVVGAGWPSLEPIAGTPLTDIDLAIFTTEDPLLQELALAQTVRAAPPARAAAAPPPGPPPPRPCPDLLLLTGRQNE